MKGLGDAGGKPFGHQNSCVHSWNRLPGPAAASEVQSRIWGFLVSYGDGGKVGWSELTSSFWREREISLQL